MVRNIENVAKALNGDFNEKFIEENIFKDIDYSMQQGYEVQVSAYMEQGKTREQAEAKYKERLISDVTPKRLYRMADKSGDIYQVQFYDGRSWNAMITKDKKLFSISAFEISSKNSGATHWKSDLNKKVKEFDTRSSLEFFKDQTANKFGSFGRKME